MVDPFQTLRFRLTGQYVVIFGLLQVFMWVSVYFIINNHLRSRFDNELLRRAQAIAAEVDKPSLESKPADQRVRQLIDAFATEQFYILVTLQDGRPAIRSGNAQGLSFPVDSSAPAGAMQPAFMTLDDVGAASEGEPIRVVTIQDDGRSACRAVQVGAKMGTVERVLLDIKRMLVVFVTLSLFLAGVSSWVVAGRTLKPIGVIAREANALTAARLNQRITVPGQNDEVSEMVVAINSMLSRLEGQFKNAHDFISNASHELKTPLAIMLGHVQNVRRSAGLTEEVLGFLDSAEEELWRMLKIVESCLILTRARNAERLRLNTPVEIEEVVITAIRACGSEASKRGVKIVPRFSGGESIEEGPVVTGDADLLATMVENLVGNAVRYSASSGVVELEVKSTLKEVALAVRDRGPGIPEEHIERIFELCYQVDPNSETAGKCGIGLTIVQAVADLHGGAVDVANRAGGGCVFTVRLPRSHGEL